MLPDSSNQSEDKSACQGAEIVQELLKRQEQVLADLDVLNERVESTIRSITETRKRELENQNEINTPDELMQPLAKVA